MGVWQGKHVKREASGDVGGKKEHPKWYKDMTLSTKEHGNSFYAVYFDKK